MNGYEIYFQKDKAGSPVKNSLVDFNIVCVDFPFQLYPETKNLVSDDWPEEHGEDVFFPDKLPLKAYDLEAELCYVGNSGSAYDDIVSFLDYLRGEDGNGTSLKIYNPHTKIGRQKLYLKSVDDDIFHSDVYGDIVLFSVTFRVTDPKTKITPTVTGGNVTNLS